MHNRPNKHRAKSYDGPNGNGNYRSAMASERGNFFMSCFSMSA